jgi:hypothetical protein
VDDPGVPVMLGLLAVPVGVLLFVVTLVLMGGRWTSPAVLEEPEQAGEPAPPGWGLEPLPVPPDPPGRPAGGRALPAARPLLALPPARPRYGAYPHDTYSPDVYARDTYSEDVYARDARDPYESEREPDVSSQRQAFPYGPYRHQ